MFVSLFLNSVMVVEVINNKSYCSAELQAQTIRATSLAAPEICFTESHKMYRAKKTHTEHNFFLHGTPRVPYILLPIHVEERPASVSVSILCHLLIPFLPFWSYHFSSLCSDISFLSFCEHLIHII